MSAAFMEEAARMDKEQQKNQPVPRGPGEVGTRVDRPTFGLHCTFGGTTCPRNRTLHFRLNADDLPGLAKLLKMHHAVDRSK